MLVGITGGIGSGKSKVAEFFSRLGYPVFNSDQVAKEMYYQPQVRERVIHLLGEDSYKTDGSLNKEYVGARIFGDPILLGKLNEIIHPAVAERAGKFYNRYPNRIVFKESALLFETGLNKECDLIIVVTASSETRIERVMQRDRTSREKVIEKMKNQLPDSDKMAGADYVVHNNDEDMLIPQLLKILHAISGSDPEKND